MLVVAIAAGMLLANTFIHALFMMGGVGLLRRWRDWRDAGARRPPRMAAVSVFVLIMFLASIVEICVWAALYVNVGAIEDTEPSLYFSALTYTTVGYGDVVLGTPFRTLGTLEALVGMMMVGWTTALLFAVVQEVYFPERSPKRRDRDN
jgi:hypothetical protein